MKTRRASSRELDRIDLNILRILQDEGRISYVELGERVGLSTTPCMERVKRLEREKFITGYGARLNPQKLQANLLVFVDKVAKHLLGPVPPFVTALVFVHEISHV